MLTISRKGIARLPVDKLIRKRPIRSMRRIKNAGKCFMERAGAMIIEAVRE
jgi:hypothetical protein